MESREHASNTSATQKKERTNDLIANRLYSSKEVCKILKVSLQALRRSIASGRIKTVRIGKILRIPSQEIEKLSQVSETEFVDAKEAAAMLNVSKATIRALIKIGKIKGFRLAGSGGHYKIPKSEIERIASKGI